MGVYCEINLFKPVDGVYTPGSTVSGKIKYCLDKETVFSKIIVSLKGHGWLVLDDDFQKSNDQLCTYRNSENYVDVENIIYDNVKGEPLPAGSYETEFNYQLPQNIPGSLKYMNKSPQYTVWCNIKYYVRIKFEKSELLSFNKHYKKKITVVSGVTPRLPTEPTVYGEQTSLFQLGSLFSSKKSIVNIKATVANSVLKPGGSVKIDYEVENSTNLTLKAVEIKLIQVDSFTVKGKKEARIEEDVKETDIKYGAMQSGETKTFSDEITIPAGLASLDHSKIIARDYAVAITAVIPMPHRNLVLEIPIQVVDRLESSLEASGSAPPSYWEAMGEEKKEVLGRDDSSDEEKEKS
ncbi:uncharacterized protein LOC133526443 [Cydia pomonella]|uniref:uncharacterized protein LOC133526443 n=1 Tax=Cydia pomonella TaxID=82600 RepID=UPI002ADD81F6|nr:uncharacterized protein LOC133526443 [Cydia pomonella]